MLNILNLQRLMRQILLENIYQQFFHEKHGYRFSFREVQIISFLISGYTTKKIALFFGLSPRTIDNHLRNIITKVDGNSRQNIVDYINSSSEMPLFRLFFDALQMQNLFYRHVEALRKEISRIQIDPVLIKAEDSSPAFFIEFLIDTFKAIGISCKPAAPGALVSERFIEIEIVSHTTNTSLEDISPLSDILWIISSESFMKEKEFQLNNPTSKSYLNKIGDYYATFFRVLEQLSLSDPIKKLAGIGINEISEKKDQWFLKAPSTPKNLIFRHKAVISILVVGALFLVLILYNSLKNPTLGKSLLNAVRSEVSLPNKKLLLNREEIINKIQTSFEGDSPIKVTLITGIGGAGKTTIARQFIHGRHEKVVWEVNSDTKESLLQSFEHLASRLAVSNQDKKELNSAQQQKNLLNYEEKIISFVKSKLRTSEWFLLFDNVRSFKQIKKYFPNDPKIWGNGKVLIASQNKHLVNTQQVQSVVTLGELNEKELFNLFKINMALSSQSKNFSNEQEVIGFLFQLPPYPLDVLIAANYIKSTNVSHQDYIKFIKKKDDSFQHMQQKILYDTGEYQMTRAKIIKLSLDQMVQENSDYKELLAFIAHCYAQGISRNILTKLKPPIAVDSFIYSLKKYSLINVDEDTLSPKIYLHSTIQEEFRRYVLTFKDTAQNLKNIIKMLYHEGKKSISNEDFDRMKDLYMHLKMILHNSPKLETEEAYLLKGCLGVMYYYLGEDNTAVELLQSSILFFSKKPSQEGHLAWLYIYLANEFRRLGRYRDAVNLYKESIRLYENDPKNQDGYARAAAYLGKLYEKLGRYDESKALLEKSYTIYKKLPHDNIQIGWIQSQLGKVLYRKEEYAKSITLYEKSIENYKKVNNQVGLSWVYGRIALSYTKLKHFDKALAYIEESLKICTQYFNQEHTYLAKALFKAAVYYKNTKDYKRSEDLLKKSLKILQNNSEETNPNMADFFSEVGELYLLMGKSKKAHFYLSKAVEIYRKYNIAKQELLMKLLAATKQP